MLKESPLINEHRRLGAKFIPFHGWKLPLEYSGSRKEHLSVRNHAGLFDVSHMGEIRVRGAQALTLLNRALTNDASVLRAGQIQYTMLCNEKGGIIDDLILYCLKPREDYLLCVNSARKEVDLKWLKQVMVYKPGYVKSTLEKDFNSWPITIEDESSSWVQLALQGPRAPRILERLIKEESILQLKKNHFQKFSFLGESILVSATGYTGERGFEILLPPSVAHYLWAGILEQDKDCVPVGLAARDTLRIEMKYPLYGNELNEEIDPYSAYLSWVVKNQNDFLGSQALAVIKKRIKRKWIGFAFSKKEGMGVPRLGYRILTESGQVIGEVTSGAYSPSLEKMIGMGYVPIEYSSPGQAIKIEVHQNHILAEVKKTPFYQKT